METSGTGQPVSGKGRPSTDIHTNGPADIHTNGPADNIHFGSGNGLVSNRQQAITRTDDD